MDSRTKEKKQEKEGTKARKNEGEKKRKKHEMT
jgi:hypothetical protein